jgi:hypothetical protein
MANSLRFALVTAILAGLLPAQTVYRSRGQYGYGTPNPQSYKIAGSFHGTVKELTKKEIMIETGDEQTVSLRITGKTKFLKNNQPIKPSDIETETVVTVDAAEDVDLKLTAMSVMVGTPPKSNDSK